MENIMRNIMYISMGICCVGLIWVAYIAMTSGLVINVAAPGFTALEKALLLVVFSMIPAGAGMTYFDGGEVF